MEIESFHAILSSLTLAKELYDIDRYDVVEKGFSDELCWDNYYENILAVIMFVFSGYEGNYNEDDNGEIMVLKDDVISDYFIYAMEYGKKHKLSHDQNPYVTQANNEVSSRFGYCYCVNWKFLTYTKTKKAARKSKLIILIYTDCGCNAHEHTAYNLIKLYSWFRDKCAEFKVTEVEQTVLYTTDNKLAIHQNPSETAQHLYAEAIESKTGTNETNILEAIAA